MGAGSLRRGRILRSPPYPRLGGFEIGEDRVLRSIERAEARGEVREKLPPRARTLPIDLMRNELLQRGPDIPEPVIEEIVDDVFLPLVLA